MRYLFMGCNGLRNWSKNVNMKNNYYFFTITFMHRMTEKILLRNITYNQNFVRPYLWLYQRYRKENN